MKIFAMPSTSLKICCYCLPNYFLIDFRETPSTILAKNGKNLPPYPAVDTPPLVGNSCSQARSLVVAWGTPGRQDAGFLPPMAFFHCCFTSAAKERPPEILLELNLSLFNILKSSIFSYRQMILLIV